MSTKSNVIVVRTTPEVRQAVEKISADRDWTFSKTCEKLVALAIQHKLL